MKLVRRFIVSVADIFSCQKTTKDVLQEVYFPVQCYRKLFCFQIVIYFKIKWLELHNK